MPDASSRPPEGAPPRPDRQAVLFIHGIGEQQPMQTLWKLVELVWLKAPATPGAPQRRVYSEPDDMSGVFELRRLSTGFNADGRRTDFFEFYWAHLMRDNTIGDVFSWLFRLAIRPRSVVPEALIKPWRVLHMIAAAIVVLIMMAMSAGVFVGLSGHLNEIVVLIGVLFGLYGLLALADHLFFSPVVGDAARYFRPSPKNVPCRQEIRSQGLRLLQALHRSRKYDRIVLVGHSLGGVIAYELALLLWGQRNRYMDRPGVQSVLQEAEAAALALSDDKSEANAARWHGAQKALFEALRDEKDENGEALWLISDLVTLGSPIAHAPTLLAESPTAFAQSLERRDMATAPPQFETFRDGTKRFSYCRRPSAADDAHAGPRAPHNAAVFAALRWTNIFFPVSGWLRGDFMGGPAAPAFGPGVRDLPVREARDAYMPHTDYLRADVDPLRPASDLMDHRAALREALALEGAAAPVRAE